MDLDKLTPEEYRARYEALQAAARALAARPPAVGIMISRPAGTTRSVSPPAPARCPIG